MIMNSIRKSFVFHRRNRRRTAFDRINEALERNAEPDNSVRIRQMRRAYFADVDALEASGKLKLPR
jgi:hypothetical protein